MICFSSRGWTSLLSLCGACKCLDQPSSITHICFNLIEYLVYFVSCSMNSVRQERTTDRKDWKVAYLNPTFIAQSQINPVFNERDPKYKDMTPKEMERMVEDFRNVKRAKVANYICSCFIKWQDRQCIIALYNFE